MDRILDRLLPTYDFHSRYTRDIAAAPDAVWQALHEVSTVEMPVTRLLMGIRSAGRARLRGTFIDSAPLPELDRIPGREVVNGAVARYWQVRPSSAPAPIRDPEEFRTFDEPGWAKAAMSLHLAPGPTGTRLTAETRIRTTDAASHRRFAAYWLLIRFGGGLIRQELLRATARRAERAAGRQ